MTTYALEHLGDEALLAALSALVTTSRATDAALLAHLAEVDSRGLYLPAACASMHVYCVRVLSMSEDAAFKRITAARTARRFPAIFAAVADGRLHLSAVRMLSVHLTDDNVDELVAAASHRSKRELEVMLAEKAPRPAGTRRSATSASCAPPTTSTRPRAGWAATSSLPGERGGARRQLVAAMGELDPSSPR